MEDEEQNGAVSLPKGAAAVNKMIRENSDIFSDSHCKVCSAVLISESQKLAHYQSMKHANKVRRYLSIHKDEEPVGKKFKPPSPDNDNTNGEEDRMKACPVCNMTFSSPVVAQSHYQGKVHSKNLKLKEQGIPEKVYPQSKTVPKKPSPVSASPDVSAGSDPEKFCSICHASFNNPLMSKQHYVGKKHKKQMTKVKLMEHYGPSSAPASLLNILCGKKTPQRHQHVWSIQLIQFYRCDDSNVSTKVMKIKHLTRHDCDREETGCLLRSPGSLLRSSGSRTTSGAPVLSRFPATAG
ncbi:zinc finger protein 346-like isoform X1 [Polyodon spathula]|uniref:zinc finger protein 346-like isoform X1 n=1 Tax=Polyodon spathula TaxID=7913 RepID=UPI001B7EBE53|nr:zinc finger protein 346-like isoform X1 [Polyodon spathula]